VAFPISPVVANPAVARVDATLPAAGAWDTAPVEIACAGYDWCRFYFAYTRGGAGGAFSFRYQISPYYADDATHAADWYDQTIYAPAPLTPCEDVCSEIQNEYITYCATSEDTETAISVPIQLMGCVERLRVQCAESGNVDAPGDLEVVVLFYGHSTEG